jgi:hypothetical protein
MRLAPRSRVEGNTRELDADEALTVARRLLKGQGQTPSRFQPAHHLSGTWASHERA